MDQLWKELVVINEVYPDPTKAEVQKITECGCVLYHVGGVRGFFFPPIPNGYSGCIPCCAAIMHEKVEAHVTKLKAS